MALRNNVNAMVWEVKPGTKYDGSPAQFTEVRLSTSRLKQGSNPPEYENDYSGYVRFIGDAHKMAAGLREKDKIRLNEISVTGGLWNKEERRATPYYFQCYSFSPADDSTRTQQTQPQRATYNPSAGLKQGMDTELPFA